MAEYLFDGKRLKKRTGQKEGEIDGTNVRAWDGKQVGEIQGKSIRDTESGKVLEYDGKNLKDDTGKKLAAIEEIRKVVEGEAGIRLAAAWYFFVWKSPKARQP